MDAHEIKEFECPVCSLKRWLIEMLGLKEAPPKTTERLLGGIAEELKSRGIMPKERELYKEVHDGVPIPPEVQKTLPVGSEMPAYAYVSDICTECGAYYAVKLQRMTAPAGQTPTQAPPRLDIARLHLPGMDHPRHN